MIDNGKICVVGAGNWGKNHIRTLSELGVLGGIVEPNNQKLEAFSKFGSDLDKATLAQLTRGERMVEILKQNQYVPMDVEKQVTIIFAASKGHLDDIDISKVSEFETGLSEYLDANAADSLASIVSEGKISDEIADNLEKAIVDYKAGFNS